LKFLSYNVIGGITWVASMTLVGYYLGRSIPDIEKHLHIVVGAVIIVSFLPLFHEILQARRKK
jgi:membrane-associated protein